MPVHGNASLICMILVPLTQAWSAIFNTRFNSLRLNKIYAVIMVSKTFIFQIEVF